MTEIEPRRVGLAVQRWRSGSTALGMISLLLGLTFLAACRRADETPSVLLIVVDTLRADHVGALGRPGDDEEQRSTPLLDRWAGAAARFRRATTPAPFTLPAMAALMSGFYPDRCGVNAQEVGTSLLGWRGTTIAEAAKRGGLRTAAVISHPLLALQRTGFDRGFDQVVRLLPHAESQARDDTSSATAVTDGALRTLESLRDRPFFLWVHYFDPHMPYEPPAEFVHAVGAGAQPSRVMSDFKAPGRNLGSLYKGAGYRADEIEHARRLYAGSVRYVDHEIGRLLDTLEGLGLADRTHVIIASDHGESLGEHGLYFAHAYTLYDELTRVALMVRGPGVAAGLRDDDVSLIDLAPTICRLAKLDCPRDFDGRDLFLSPRGGRTLFAAATPLRAQSSAFDRLEVPGLEGRWSMALDHGTKLLRIPTKAGPVFELYDRSNDPRELVDLGSSASARANDLATQLEAWSEAMRAARSPTTTE